jgi:hypothetical protein
LAFFGLPGPVIKHSDWVKIDKHVCKCEKESR